jgi:hypothetical protein
MGKGSCFSVAEVKAWRIGYQTIALFVPLTLSDDSILASGRGIGKRVFA